MSRRRTHRMKQSAVKTTAGRGNKKRRTIAATTTPDQTASLAETLRINEELAKEAQEVGLVTMLAIDAPVAHRVALKVIGIYPYVEVRKNQTRLEASILYSRRKLDRNDRHYKKQVEEGITAARNALTIAQLAVDKREQQQLVGASPR